MVEIRHSHETINGVRHHIAEAGPADAAPILLLHGWPEFWATWEPVMNRLGHRWRLIAPDYRGFGESENPYAGPTDKVGADSLADDMAALMRHIGVPSAVIAGHDMGAFVMQRMAIRHSELVKGLFFGNCATHGVGTRWRNPEMIPEIWYQTFHQQPYAAAIVGSSRESVRAHIGHFLRHWCHRKNAFDPVLDRWVDNFMRPGNLQGGFNWYIGQNAGRLAVMAGTAPKPPMIRQPTRVLWGRHDPVLRAEWADVLNDYFSDIEIGFAEDAGHFVHYETPDLFARELDSFAGRLLASG